MPQPSLRGRVEQQVDALAGSANKVLTGVVDTSFGVLRALLTGQAVTTGVPETEAQTPPIDAVQGAAPWNVPPPRFGLLRRDTHFSIASIAASLPGRAKTPAAGEESGQQMIEVPSRPGSSRSMRPEDASEEESSEAGDEEDDEEEEEEYEEEHDARSIRSFESMMSQRSRQARKRKTTKGAAASGGRKSLADRLASVPGLGRLSQGTPSEVAKVRLSPLIMYHSS